MRKLAVLAFAVMAVGGLTASAARADDPAEGKKVFNRVCNACHTDQAGGPKKLGPSLFGVVGRKAGTMEGFRYSEANKNSGLTWTPEELDKYLKDPKAVVPGTTMAFAGVKKDDDRKQLIAYLQTLK